MRVLIVGASGTIGKAVAKELKKLDIEVLLASKSSSEYQVDLSSTSSIIELYNKVGPVDAVVCTPKGAHFKKTSEMAKEDYEEAFKVKLLGQIDLVLNGISYLNEGGSFTLTSGIIKTVTVPKASCASTINGGIEGFVKIAAFELPKQMRLNVVSPNLLKESQEKYKDLFVGFDAISAERAALAYVRSIAGVMNGEVIEVF
jgi:NAD(P)-dependent dehydrogenase (short-subunit alcohol dehydrogenase family)